MSYGAMMSVIYLKAALRDFVAVFIFEYYLGYFDRTLLISIAVA